MVIFDKFSFRTDKKVTAWIPVNARQATLEKN